MPAHGPFRKGGTEGEAMSHRDPDAHPAARRRAPFPLLALAGSLLALGIGCATAGTAPPPSPAAETYRVGPPDQLTVTVLPEPVIERNVTVRPDGKFSLDLIGDVQAAGRTTLEIAREIEERIARFKRDATVNVALAQSLSTQVTVLGEVFSPRTFPLERETRVIEALGRVGGPTIFAAKSRIRVIRFIEGETRVMEVDLDDISEGDLSTNLTLQGGDLVMVPPSVSTSIGNAIRVIFYPLQQILGLGAGPATRVVVGGY